MIIYTKETKERIIYLPIYYIVKMDKKDVIDKINIILSQKELDDRVKPLVKLFFLGKSSLNNLSIDQIAEQIEILCSKIENTEFSNSDNIIAAYEEKGKVLTINKKLFLEKRSDEVIVPIFMKFEEALNQYNRKDYGSHIEDFINASQVAKAISIPMSERLYRLYKMAEYCYGDIEYKIAELIKERIWQGVCYNYNKVLNNMIVTGKDDQQGLLDGARLFHNEVFDSKAFNNQDFKGPFKTEEYQKKASKILACIDKIKPKKCIMQFNYNNNDNIEKEGLIKNIKLFTGCTDEMIEVEKTTKYNGDSRISASLEATLSQKPKEITEEVIVNKVQEIIDRKPEWDSRVKHLIIPFFIRSQKIYNWNIDEFQERVNELDLKINKITFEDLESSTVMGSTAGDAIKLNSKVFLDKKRQNCMACI